ncbi:serine--tRNA ligase [Aceticella autotrophica]|uniref:Serine--tRNA ligase n=1 Tax=Aceticella autotrophica TaxID=2755338 RepID=A0A975AVV1_9THEO|nr:serine--tRNA ligase [Aceticella autotrophica]QSZ27392.1 serine--tRNA ligase [Aceticella autotrophica]
MLDIKRIRNNPEAVKRAIELKKENTNIDEFLKIDEKRRQMLLRLESLKNKRNIESENIAKLKREGKDVSDLISDMKGISERIKEMESELKDVEEKIDELIWTIPNIPDKSVPVGDSDADNIEIRKWGLPRKFDFKIKPHWDLGVDLDILDFETASKVTGSRFTFYKGLGSRLERSLINFMLDLHTEKHGYTEIFPPFMVHRRSMYGTGQLPKFEEDAFKVAGTDYFLIPTAEVPVTNMYRDTIIDGDKLPIYHCAFSTCFRQEAGSAGRDTRGLIRQHQFNKVELVKFTEPDKSYEELEKMTNDAEDVLKELGLPYRVVAICTGDLGFTAAKKYDIEVWMPSYGRYVEISSCSNCEDFQARRANIKFRPKEGGKAQFVHTLNGSGVAVGRTFAAILENYQKEDGSVIIPEALKPYMKLEILKK